MHALHLKRLMNLLDTLVQYAEEWRDAQLKVNNGNGPAGKARAPEVEVMTSAELLQRLGRKTEGVNLLEVEKYLRESKVRVRASCVRPLAHWGCLRNYVLRLHERYRGTQSRRLRRRQDKVSNGVACQRAARSLTRRQTPPNLPNWLAWRVQLRRCMRSRVSLLHSLRLVTVRRLCL